MNTYHNISRPFTIDQSPDIVVMSNYALIIPLVSTVVGSRRASK